MDVLETKKKRSEASGSSANNNSSTAMPFNFHIPDAMISVEESRKARDAWVATLPTDKNRAPLGDIEPLLMRAFSPGEMSLEESEAFAEYEEVANTAYENQQKRLKKKKKKSTSKEQTVCGHALSEEEELIEESPYLSEYMKHFPLYKQVYDLNMQRTQEKSAARLGRPDGKELMAYLMMVDARWNRHMTVPCTIIRMLVEHYPKLWVDFIKCKGKSKFKTVESILAIEEQEKRTLAMVCHFFDFKLPEQILPENNRTFEMYLSGDLDANVIPPHPSECLWAVEGANNDALSEASKTAKQAAVEIALKIQEAYKQEEDNQFKNAKEIRVLDAGCGDGVFGKALQDALHSFGLLKSPEHPDRPEVSIYGFDNCLYVLATLSESLKEPNTQREGVNLYGANDKKKEQMLFCLDPTADRDAFQNAFTPGSFDFVVSCDFLMYLPTFAMPGVRTFQDCLGLVKPGGTMLVTNAVALISPATFCADFAAITTGDETFMDNVECRFAVLPEADQLLPAFAHTFTKTKKSN